MREITKSVGRSWLFGFGCCVAICANSLPIARAESPVVLERAHAHNDYWHERPLVDALKLGFVSVEADVFLVAGELLVGHDPSELRPERTLEALYLAPLRDRAWDHGGAIFGDGTRLTLLVDFKSDGRATNAALHKLLERYADVVSSVADGQYQPRAVDIVVSGNRPLDMIRAERMRYAAVDGRLDELNGELPVHLVPLVSESWLDHFKWDGRGEMPAGERSTLEAMVQRVHTQRRRLRFWATPETQECWQELLAANVDLIGTDDLGKLAGFFSQTKRATK